MLAYPPLSISFKMYVQSSFIYPLTLTCKSLTSNYLFTYIFILSAYSWLINYVKLTTKFTLCKQSLHYPPRLALAILQASVVVCIFEYLVKSLSKL